MQWNDQVLFIFYRSFNKEGFDIKDSKNVVVKFKDISKKIGSGQLKINIEHIIYQG